MEADKGMHTYRKGINQFSDMSFAEFKASQLSGLKTPPNLKLSTPGSRIVNAAASLPTSVGSCDFLF
jgi:hypothetical protein